jgi:hypothetical protein
MSLSRLSRRTLVAALAAAIAFASTARAQTTEPSLDGYWAGTLVNITGSGIAPPPDGEFPVIRLQIDQRNVRVYSGQDEVKPGTFEITRNGTNAVITSIQSDPGAPDGQSWVETWTFVVSLADANTLIVNYVRVVNNNNAPSTETGARFTQVRTGLFRRVQPDHV